MSEPAPGEAMLYLYRLKPGAGPEYDRRHAEVSPELLADIRAAGIHDYSIFRNEEIVVCRLRARDGRAAAEQRLEVGKAQARWSASLAHLFEATMDASGEPLWLREVFRLD